MPKFIISYSNKKWETIEADEIKMAAPTILTAIINNQTVGYWNMNEVRYFRNKELIKNLQEPEKLEKKNDTSWYKPF